MVLLKDSEQLVPRSNVRPARDPLYPNLRERPRTDDLRPTRRPVVETVSENDEEAAVQPDVTSGEESNPSPSPDIDSGFQPTRPKSPNLTSVQDYYDVPVSLPRFSPEELIGLTFLYDTGDGERVRAKVTKKIQDKDAENHQRIKMLLSYDDGKIEELIAYNELCDIVAEQHEKEAQGEVDLFCFREILEHEGPLPQHDPRYKGLSYCEDSMGRW